jgi:Chalcone isomerase-like
MKILVAILCSFLLSWNANALEVADVKLPDTAQVGSQTLALNGAGLRKKWFFKVYVCALYLPQKQASAETIINEDPEYRIAMYMKRGLGSKRLYGAFREAIEANHTPAELATMDPQLKQMAAIFDDVKEVEEGDVISLDYLPGTGTQVRVNDTVRGTIVGAEFSRALLRIWLGNKPAQDDLKKEMLGG